MKIDLSDQEIEYLLRVLVLNYADREEDIQPDILNPPKIRESLLSKLLNDNNFYLYPSIHKEQFSAKDSINLKLFMGTGWHSVVEANKLHKRLEFAISQLGGEQQNGGMGTEYDEQSAKVADEDIKSVLRDIIFAFGYKPEDL